MSQIDNLANNSAAVQDIMRRLRALEFATNQNSMAIGRGGLSVYGGGGITIENGGLSVTGSATIVGTLNADGTINMTGLFIASGEMRLNGTTIATGDFNIDGPLLVDGDTTFNGTLNINGLTTIDGDTSVTGKLDLTGTLNVLGGGQIKAGNVNITPDASNGGIEFTTGGGVGANGGAIVVKGSGDAGLISNPTMASVFAGPNSVEVSPTAVTINGPLKANGITSTTNAANVYFNPVSKQFYYKP